MAKNRDYNYYNKFVELIDYSCQCSKILEDTLANFNTRTIETKLEELHKMKHTADLVKRELMQQLAVEFIPPLEREDIVNLSQKLNNLTDTIEGVLIKIHIYNVQAMKSDIFQFTKLVSKFCYALKAVLEEFHNYKKSTSLKAKLIEVNDLEEEVNRLYYKTVARLYCESKNPVELLVWTGIYDCFEKCYDACKVIADVIESIIMKNS